MNPFPAGELVALKADMAFFEAEKCMVLPHTNVVSRMEAGPSLADDDVPWYNFLRKKNCHQTRSTVAVRDQCGPTLDNIRQTRRRLNDEWIVDKYANS